MTTRATTDFEQNILDRNKRRTRNLTIAKWCIGIGVTLLLLALLVRYCAAEVRAAQDNYHNINAWVAGRDIQAYNRVRSLRLSYDLGMKAIAADSAAAHDTNNRVTSHSGNVCKGNAPGESAPAHYNGIKSAVTDCAAGCENLIQGDSSENNSAPGIGPAHSNNAYPVFPPFRSALVGNVTTEADSGGVCPGPAALSSADLWASDDSTTRRDFIAQHFVSYGLSSDEAARVADVCIEFAQCNGADLFFTVGTVTAESGGNRNAVNRSSGCTGLWQISPVHKKRMRRLGLDFGTEEGRTAMAHVLYSESGWRPWKPSARKARKIASALEASWNSKDRGD